MLLNCVCCPAGVLCIRAVWGQQSGVLHDPEQELHHELVKEQRRVLSESLKHTQSNENKVSVTYSHTQDEHTVTLAFQVLPRPLIMLSLQSLKETTDELQMLVPITNQYCI